MRWCHLSQRDVRFSLRTVLRVTLGCVVEGADVLHGAIVLYALRVCDCVADDDAALFVYARDGAVVCEPAEVLDLALTAFGFCGGWRFVDHDLIALFECNRCASGVKTFLAQLFVVGFVGGRYFGPCWRWRAFGD